MRRRTALTLSLGTVASRVAADDGAVWATPHDSYSSSIGVLGCKINTNRVAYWPGSVDCTNICVSLSYDGRTVNLLRVDQSQGAHDVSYDAWNYLYTGYSATEKPTAGGAVAMNYAEVDASQCADLIHTEGSKLPLSAANSMNFLASCLAQPDSWVAKNYVLYNILDSTCFWGHDEVCSLDWPAANQASCPSALGDPANLTDAPVYNIRYPSGQTVVASSGQVVPAQDDAKDDESAGWLGKSPNLVGLVLVMTFSIAGANVHF
ncbi:hypothetical protein F4805DRAFT_140732 [Annulohypoxylon moriforme]|nr:hypothetical protein F4805DRAFT_140732 [Annulohypoxylon moriforme]